MAHFALLWKARTIEKYRQNYESEKIKSIMSSNSQLAKQSLSQRWKYYRYDTQKRITSSFRKWYPEGSSLSNLIYYLKTDQTFPNFVLKSVLGFFGGIILTYLCFMFFVFQLSISLIHATIMSSIIGVLLTLGLAFSYRIRCLVFLLIPQFFSRVGRYTLTCYALVLILTGPATNTLKNSEVLSESLACGQEQIKTNVKQINSLMTKPLNSLKDAIKLMVERVRHVAVKMKQLTLKISRLVLNIAQVIQSGFLWLNSLSSLCKKKIEATHSKTLEVPNQKRTGSGDLVHFIMREMSEEINMNTRKKTAFRCSLKPGVICVFMEHLNGDIVPIIRKRLRNYSARLANMLSMRVHVHHSYSFSSNDSRSASQVAAGIVTEIRKRADPLLTWLSWSSCVTSLFLLLIIFRAKNYQHMFETRSRFDNRYITKEIRILDLKRLREGRETILPLNRRERAKYVTTTSFRLVASEKAYLNRSVVFMSITTFKLLIHMVADYSLYWVLMTIRYHGRLQTVIHPGPDTSEPYISGTGPTADLLKSLLAALGVLVEFPASTPISCLPNPHPPDFTRYMQIVVLIVLLWFFAMFEPYGLRLRHVVMGHYQPERAKARADWLYNHILRTRGGFMKFARRKLHRMYKYKTEEMLTFRRWLNGLIPSSCLRFLLGTSPEEPHCLLCGTTYYAPKSDTELIRCRTSNCPGIYCVSCFADIGELCTICLSPRDYGDHSDVSLEKGSSDESDDDGDEASRNRSIDEGSRFSICETQRSDDTFSIKSEQRYQRGIFSKMDRNLETDSIPLLPRAKNGNYPKDDSKIINKALLVRHMKHSMDQRFYRNEKEHWIYCENCERRYCKNQNTFTGIFQNIDFHTVKTNKKERKDHISKHKKPSKERLRLQNAEGSTEGVKKSNHYKNTRRNCYNGNCKSKHLRIKKPSNFMEKVLSVVSQPSIYSIRVEGTKVKVEKFKQNANTDRPKKIKSNHKKPAGNAKLKSEKKEKKSKSVEEKKAKSDRKKDVNSNKETGDNLTVKPSQSTCHCFKHFRMLFNGLFRQPRKRKSLGAVKNTKFLSKDKINHKRRKKKKTKKSKSADAIFKSAEIGENDDTRNYRISAYLDDQNWIKRECKPNDNEPKRKAEISEAVAVINSTSKCKKKQKGYREEIDLNLAPFVNKSIETYRPDENEKNISFGDLWKKIGFRLLSETSSSSFIENAFRRTQAIFGKDSEMYSSSDITRRLRYYASLGNDDFKTLVEEFKDDIYWSLESDEKENIGTKVQIGDRQQILDESSCNTGTKEYLMRFKKLRKTNNKHITAIKKCIESKSYGRSMTYLRRILSKSSNDETKEDLAKGDDDTSCHCVYGYNPKKVPKQNRQTKESKAISKYRSANIETKGISTRNPNVLIVASQSEKDANDTAVQKSHDEKAKFQPTGNVENLAVTNQTTEKTVTSNVKGISFTIISAIDRCINAWKGVLGLSTTTTGPTTTPVAATDPVTNSAPGINTVPVTNTAADTTGNKGCCACTDVTRRSTDTFGPTTTPIAATDPVTKTTPVTNTGVTTTTASKGTSADRCAIICAGVRRHTAATASPTATNVAATNTVTKTTPANTTNKSITPKDRCASICASVKKKSATATPVAATDPGTKTTPITITSKGITATVPSTSIGVGVRRNDTTDSHDPTSTPIAAPNPVTNSTKSEICKILRLTENDDYVVEIRKKTSSFQKKYVSVTKADNTLLNRVKKSIGKIMSAKKEVPKIINKSSITESTDNEISKPICRKCPGEASEYSECSCCKKIEATNELLKVISKSITNLAGDKKSSSHTNIEAKKGVLGMISKSISKADEKLMRIIPRKSEAKKSADENSIFIVPHKNPAKTKVRDSMKTTLRRSSSKKIQVNPDDGRSTTNKGDIKYDAGNESIKSILKKQPSVKPKVSKSKEVKSPLKEDSDEKVGNEQTSGTNVEEEQTSETKVEDEQNSTETKVDEEQTSTETPPSSEYKSETRVKPDISKTSLHSKRLQSSNRDVKITKENILSDNDIKKLRDRVASKTDHKKNSAGKAPNRDRKVSKRDSKVSNRDIKKLSDSKDKIKEIDKVDPECACKCLCSDEELNEAKETCTCATQYMPGEFIKLSYSRSMKMFDEFFSVQDEDLQKEIYGYTSSSTDDTIFTPSFVTDPSHTDCTICSLAYTDELPRYRRRAKVRVVTKANQCTGPDKPRLCDVGTLTKDWWSPIVERKKNEQIKVDTNIQEKRGKNDIIGDQARKMKGKAVNKNEGRRIVTFRSRAQIIPADENDTLTPSRYLLESQWYYNELFSSKLYAPHVCPVFQKPTNGSRKRSPTMVYHNTRRNHKTKRLDECYSPRNQVISPRRQTGGYEWIRTNESRDGHKKRRLLRTKTRNINKEPKNLRPLYGNISDGQDEKLQSINDISLHGRCNSTSSL